MHTEDVVDRLELAFIRALLQMDVTEPTDRLAAAVGLQRRLDKWATRELLVARDDGTTYAQLARTIGVLRRVRRCANARPPPHRHPDPKAGCDRPPCTPPRSQDSAAPDKEPP